MSGGMAFRVNEAAGAPLTVGYAAPSDSLTILADAATVTIPDGALPGALVGFWALGAATIDGTPVGAGVHIYGWTGTAWEELSSAAAAPLTAPTPTVGSVTSSTIVVSWTPVAGATSYDLRVDGSTVVTGVTSPRTVSGLAASHTGSVELRSVGATTSGWSAPVAYTTSASGAPAIATVLLSDTFNRADGALGSTDSAAGGGTNTTWAFGNCLIGPGAVAATYAVAGNALSASGATDPASTGAYLPVTFPGNDFQLTVTVTSGTWWRLGFWRTGTNTQCTIRMNAGDLTIEAAGAPAATTGWATTGTYTILVKGTAGTIYGPAGKTATFTLSAAFSPNRVLVNHYAGPGWAGDDLKVGVPA